MHILSLFLILATSSSLLLLHLLAVLMFLRRCFLPCGSREVVRDAERGGPQVAAEPEPAVDRKELKKPVDEVRRLEWTEVEELTGGFTTAVIGEGGFSTVYLGRSPDSGGDDVAVKVQHSSERLYRAFLQERDVLLRVRHRNIVRLLGYSDHHDSGVLVFEYVPNGTLHEKLHPVNGTLSPPSAPLPWPRRMSILFQVAAAVDHLHDGCDLQIVQGDLTASNVLLDDNLNPKLCDFGFARMGFSAAVRPAASGHMVGSPGYVDPHYLRTGIISKKSDVYSFGVLVLETISGIQPSSRQLPVAMRGKGIDELVDPTLGANFDAGELAAMGELAGRCVGERPGMRPAMAEIVEIMRKNVKL